MAEGARRLLREQGWSQARLDELDARGCMPDAQQPVGCIEDLLRQLQEQTDTLRRTHGIDDATLQHAREWHAHLLQRRHFGVVDAGEGFFRHLRQLGPQEQEVREVFALALLLGLRGQFALDADERAWKKTRDAEVARILEAAPGDESLLTGLGTHAGTDTEPRRRLAQLLRSPGGAAAAAIVALGLLFGLYALLLHQAVRNWFNA